MSLYVAYIIHTTPSVSVSYTHLDVYKRQIIGSNGIGSMNQLLDTDNQQKHKKDKMCIRDRIFTSSGTSSGKCLLAYVPGRSEYLNIKAAS